MMRSVLRAGALLLALALVAAGCGDSVTSPSTTTTTTTTSGSSTSTVPVTETFQGTLATGGSNYHIFHAMPGVFTVTLSSTNPSTTPSLAMAFGMWDGKTCTQVTTDTAVVTASVLTGTASIETDVCVRVYDPIGWDASLTVSYVVSVVHQAKAS